MSFRRRIALASAAAVAIAVVLASLLTYLLTSNQLHSQVDAAAAQPRAHGRSPAALPQTRAANRRRSPRATANGSGLDLNGLDGSTKDSEDAAAARTQSEGPGAAALRPDSRKTCSAGCRRGPTRCAATSRSSTQPARSSCARRANVSLPVDARDAAAGEARRRCRSSATRASTASTCACSPSRSARAARSQLAQPLTEVDSLLSRLRLILALLDLARHRARGAARAARRGRRGAAAQAPDAGDRARRADAGSERADQIGRRGRDRAARAQLQRDARRARALDERARRVRARAAPARRRRLARAAHAGHEPAHEHRDPAAGRAAWTPGDRRRLLGDVVEQIEELTLLINDLIELARGEEPFAAAEDVRLDLLVARGRRARAPARPGERASIWRCSRRSSRACPRGSSAR